MKRLLLLGGSEKMIPVIEYAKRQGYYLLLCDFLPDNPGQYLVDEYYEISATDNEKILALAKKKRIDGILSYSSDVIALTSAYVGNKLSLPSNPYESVKILGRKDLFRKFLKDNGFNCPKTFIFASLDEAKKRIEYLNMPVIIKPVDSAGSTCVIKLEKKSDLDEPFIRALNESKVNLVLIEEYIQMSHDHMIEGDAFVINGKIKYIGLFNSHRHSVKHPFIPTAYSYPIIINNDQIKEVTETVQKVVELLGINIGGLNIEMMYDNHGKLYIIEIAPRNGGNMIPEFLYNCTGVNIIGALVEVCLGNEDMDLTVRKKNTYYCSYVIHSHRKGILKEIRYNNGLEKNLIQEFMEVKIGEDVYDFDSAKKSIGIVFFKFDDIEEQNKVLKNIYSYIKVVLK